MKAHERMMSVGSSKIKNSVSSSGGACSTAKPIKNAVGIQPKATGKKIRGTIS